MNTWRKILSWEVEPLYSTDEMELMIADYVGDHYGISRLNGGYVKNPKRLVDVENALNSNEAERLPGPVYVYEVAYGVSHGGGNDPSENKAIIVAQQNDLTLLMPINYPFIHEYLDRQ